MRTSFWAAVFLALVASAMVLASPLRVSVPPLFGSVPVILASDAAWDLFAEEGLDMTLVPLPSQTARLQAFRAGQVDILISDLTLALMIVSQRSADGVIVGSTYTAEDAGPTVSLITQRYARITSLEDLAAEANAGRMRIGVPRQSDLEFMLDELFRVRGLPQPPAQRVYVGRDDLLKNAEFLGFGSFQAGVFPQPYGDYLMAIDFPGKPDFTVISDFAGVPVPPTVVVMRRSILEERPQEAAAFFRALDQAVERVNALPRDELLELGWKLVTQLFLPGQEPHMLAPEDREMIEQAIQALLIPDFPKPSPLDRDIFDKVLSWTRQKDYVRFPPEYDQVVLPPVR